jgi:hypothetical protein
MACRRTDDVTVDGSCIVIDPLEGDTVFRVHHPTHAAMNSASDTRERMQADFDRFGKLNPNDFLVVMFSDAWLGTREMLRRVAHAPTPHERDEAIKAAVTYLAIGFEGAQPFPPDDVVESVSIDLLPTLHELWDAEALAAEGE